jgi:hypothetical protein
MQSIEYLYPKRLGCGHKRQAKWPINIDDNLTFACVASLAQMIDFFWA